VEETEAMAPRPDDGSDCAQWERQSDCMSERAESGRPKQMLSEVRLTSIVEAESDDKVQGSSGRVGCYGGEGGFGDDVGVHSGSR
jgi:hypothetical protein